MKRRKMGHRESRKTFTRGAVKVKPINYAGAPMRGGIRL